MRDAAFLEKENISTLLWRFSLPAIMGMVVGALYNVVDSIFVGQGVGAIALTAVTIAFPIMSFLMAIGMLVGVGSSTLVSLSLGEKNEELAEKVLGNAFVLIIFLVLTTTGLAFYYMDPLLINVLGATPDVFPYAKKFISIILMGAVFFHIGFGLNNVIRAQGAPKIALATQVISAVINCILNYIFIFHMDMGIAGSAWATVLSQAVAAIWVVAYFVRGTGVLKLHARNFVPSMEVVFAILRMGSATCFMQIGATAVMIVLNLRILMYGGEVAVAAYGIICRVAMLCVMPIVGVSQGAQPIIGYNYGAQQYPRVLLALKRAIFFATMIAIAGFLSVEFYAEEIVRAFNSDSALVEEGAWGLRIFLAMLPVIGFQIVSGNYFQAIGKARYAIVFNLMRQVLILIPSVFVFSSMFGLNGVWFAGPVSDFLAVLLTGWALRRDITRHKVALGL